jgi:hypothetical protein
MKVFFAGALVVITGIAACTQVAEPPVVYGTAVYDKHGNLVGYENEFGCRGERGRCACFADWTGPNADADTNAAYDADNPANPDTRWTVTVTSERPFIAA